MLNSIEHLIDTLPEPIKNVINAMYESNCNYSWERDRNVYFALLDLKKWLDEPKMPSIVAMHSDFDSPNVFR